MDDLQEETPSAAVLRRREEERNSIWVKNTKGVYGVILLLSAESP